VSCSLRRPPRRNARLRAVVSPPSASRSTTSRSSPDACASALRGHRCLARRRTRVVRARRARQSDARDFVGSYPSKSPPVGRSSRCRLRRG
jgi:hypothetical protein